MEDENARAILRVFEDAVSPEMPLYNRLQAVKDRLAIETKEHELALRREERREDVSREVLTARIVERLALLQEAGVLPLPVVDGDASQA